MSKALGGSYNEITGKGRYLYQFLHLYLSISSPSSGALRATLDQEPTYINSGVISLVKDPEGKSTRHGPYFH